MNRLDTVDSEQSLAPEGGNCAFGRPHNSLLADRFSSKREGARAGQHALKCSLMMSAQKIGLVSLAGFSEMQSCTCVRLVVRRAFYRKMSFKR